MAHALKRAFQLLIAVLAIIAATTSAASAGATDERTTTFWWDPDYGYRVLEYYPCDNAYDWYYPSTPIDMVSNTACSRRVWLHSHIDKTGPEVCIGPGLIKTIGITYRYPALLAVGARKPCP